MRPEPPAAAKAAARTVPVLSPGMEVGLFCSFGKNWFALPLALYTSFVSITSSRCPSPARSATTGVLMLSAPTGVWPGPGAGS